MLKYHTVTVNICRLIKKWNFLFTKRIIYYDYIHFFNDGKSLFKVQFKYDLVDIVLASNARVKFNGTLYCILNNDLTNGLLMKPFFLQHVVIQHAERKSDSFGRVHLTEISPPSI